MSNIDENNVVNEEQFHTNELLAMSVSADNELKDMLVTYVGTKFDKEDVTVNMIVETLAHEFPEFVYAFAEENFLRGYQLGLDDANKSIDQVIEETKATE